MKAKITINAPKSAIEGWTGYVTLPSGKRVNLFDMCGGAPVAFNTRDKLIAAARRAATANYEVAA